ncbi:MAG: hypothetical protein U9Q17_01780, partial [Chloroflexota bacterium]|nr:hypothetical protein [Chloroflexota bacterium]
VIWDVALKNAGVMRARDIEDFCDAVKAFCTLPLMSGRRIGIVTYTGGFGIIGVDACEKFGLKLAELSSDTIEKASALSPSWLGVGNPVDIWPGMMISGNPMPFMEEESVNNLLCDWGVDAVVCVISAALRTVGAELYQITERAAREHPDKPLVFYIYGPFYEEIRSKLESTGKTLVFPNPDRAMSALSHLADYSQIRQKL